MVAGRTHHPVWDPDLCLVCGACRRACPVWFHEDLVDEPDSLRARVAREYAFPDVPGPRPVAACVAACPLHQDVPGYVSAIARGELGRAREIILRTNPLPGVLGHVCNRSCMTVCVRGRLDRSIDVRRLKAVAFQGGAPPTGRGHGRRGDEQVAIVGSGPAGLAAADALARSGVRVVVLERDGEPGGMLRHAIPAWELPRSVLDADIGRIVERGVRLETGVQVDLPRELDALVASGVRAVILATGAGRGRIPFRTPDPGLEGLLDVVAFMREVNSGRIDGIEGPVFVDGEGGAAVTAARAAARLGGSPVALVVSRPRSTLATPPVTLEQAEADGVIVIEGTVVTGVAGTGRVESVSLARCIQGRVGGGRVVPRARGDERSRPAALVVSARVREPELDAIRDVKGTAVTPVATLSVDAGTLAAGPAGLFAAGDLVSGPRNVVEAVASGLKAARSALRFLEGGP